MGLSMYAIIDDHGRQYTVRKGDLVDVDLKDATEKESITFDRVLLLRDEGGVRVGTPLVAGAKVLATVVKDVKGKKLVIRKYRRRKNYRRTQGHRQHYTRVRIESIEA
jgi:large subunit ribosomal protein L21